MTKFLKTAVLFILAFSLLIIVCTSCSQAEKQPESSGTETATFPVDVNGITFESSPLIVSLSDSASEILCEIGYKSSIIGCSDSCQTEQLAEIPRVGTSTIPNLEAIRDLVPDLLIVPSQLHADALQFFDECNIKVLVLPLKTDPKAISSDFETLATIVEGNNGTTYGQKIGESFLKHYDAFTKSVSKLSAAKKFIFISNEGFIATDDTYIASTLTNMGFENLASDYTMWNLTVDEFLELDRIPDVVFCSQAFLDSYENSHLSEQPEDATGEPENPTMYNTFPFADKAVIIDSSLFRTQSFGFIYSLDSLAKSLFPDYSGYSVE